MPKKKILVRKVYHAFWEIEVEDGTEEYKRSAARIIATNLEPDEYEHHETEYEVLQDAVCPNQGEFVPWFSD